jgi:hypothetical protein
MNHSQLFGQTVEFKTLNPFFRLRRKKNFNSSTDRPSVLVTEKIDTTKDDFSAAKLAWSCSTLAPTPCSFNWSRFSWGVTWEGPTITLSPDDTDEGAEAEGVVLLVSENSGVTGAGVTGSGVFDVRGHTENLETFLTRLHRLP